MLLEPLHPEDLPAFRELYLSAFPDWERADLGKLEAYVGRDDADLLGCYEDRLVGIAIPVWDDELLYLMYLAVSPSERGRGLGSGIITALRAMFPGRRLFLSAKCEEEGLPTYEEDVARIRFYERNGLSRNGVMGVGSGKLVTMADGTMGREEQMRFMERHELRLVFGDFPEEVAPTSGRSRGPRRSGPGTSRLRRPPRRRRSPAWSRTRGSRPL